MISQRIDRIVEDCIQDIADDLQKLPSKGAERKEA